MISIDPGLSTAIVYWEQGEIAETKILCAPPKKRGDIARLNALFTAFEDAFTGDDEIERVVIEGVRSFASARSWASSTRGNLALLAYIVGGYIHICQAFELGVELVDPKWKGQLSKHALELRIRRAGITQTLRDHEREAIGLGLSVMGRL